MIKDYVTNRKAAHEFFIEKRHVAGIALEGWEVKSIRAARISLAGAYVHVVNGELFLVGATITPLSTTVAYHKPAPDREKKLLMKKQEIMHLMGKVDQKGYTLVPLRVFADGRLIKVEIGLAKGKQQHDKRDALKSKDADREAARTMKVSRDD